MKERLRQIKFDSITTRNLHNRKIKYLNVIYKVITYLTVILPILYFIIVSLYSDAKIDSTLTIVGIILTGLLLILSIYALGEGIFEKRQSHIISIKNYNFIINSCDEILQSCKKEELNKKKRKRLDWFLRYTNEISNQDSELLGIISEKDRKFAYREALKEYDPNNTEVICPICHSSPWNYKKGSCIACGNTPVEINPC